VAAKYIYAQCTAAPPTSNAAQKIIALLEIGVLDLAVTDWVVYQLSGMPTELKEVGLTSLMV
jgi:hypothetical protein